MPLKTHYNLWIPHFLVHVPFNFVLKNFIQMKLYIAAFWYGRTALEELGLESELYPLTTTSFWNSAQCLQHKWCGGFRVITRNLNTLQMLYHLRLDFAFFLFVLKAIILFWCHNNQQIDFEHTHCVPNTHCIGLKENLKMKRRKRIRSKRIIRYSTVSKYLKN